MPVTFAVAVGEGASWRMANNGGDQGLAAQPAKDAWWLQAALDRKGRTEAKVLCKHHW